MKEISTSFQSAACSFTSRNKSAFASTFFTHFISGSILVLITCLFSTSVVSAQSAEEPIAAPITTDAYKQDVWKAVADYTQVVNTEKAETITLLANPNLSEVDYALYTGYLKLLVYMKQDLANNLPVEDIAVNSYKKVFNEALTDPGLAKMKMDAFNSIYAALLVQLHQ